MRTARTNRRTARPLRVLVAASATAFAVWLLFRTPAAAPVPRNLILISIDTCRPDYLGCYNARRALTPNIDALADTATLFENAFSPVPITLPAHCSMMSGLIPPSHGIHGNRGFRLPASVETLAERLQGKGFATAAVLSAFVLDARFGLNQGFDEYHDRFGCTREGRAKSERQAEETTQIALDWLARNKDGPFFLFVHYYDPHDAYEPPQPYATRYADEPYAGEIAYTDACVGRLLERLKTFGLFENTALVLTADHGEMLGEHGEKTHMFFVYQAAVRVPLLVRLPGRRTPKRVAQPVSLVDIMPTLCTVFRLEPPTGIQGADLSSALRGNRGTGADRYLYCESMTPATFGANPLHGLVGTRFKYIRTTRPELYEVTADPGETRNLIESESARAQDFARRLRRILQEHVRAGPSATVRLDPDAQRQLASLGYLGGFTETPPTELDPDKEDPKDLIGFHEAFLTATALLRDQDYAAAKAQFETLRRQRPDCHRVYKKLGAVAVALGDSDAALRTYEKVLQLNPRDSSSRIELAFVLKSIGRLEQAYEQVTTALSIDPEKIGALILKADLLARQGQRARALELLEQALRLDPGNTGALNCAGLVLQKEGRLADAVKHYGRSLELLPDQPEILNNLAWIHATAAEPPLAAPGKAIRLAKRACFLTDMQDPAMLDTLAIAFARAGDLVAARKTAGTAAKQADAMGRKEMAAKIRARRERFKDRQP